MGFDGVRWVAWCGVAGVWLGVSDGCRVGVGFGVCCGGGSGVGVGFGGRVEFV